MNVRTSTAARLALVALLAGCAAPTPPEIDRLEVERIIGTLAADDMEGRATFSEGIERAQSFVEREFEAAGLETMPGTTGYAQSFTVYSTSTTASAVTLNGAAIAEDRYAVAMATESIDWNADSDVTVMAVGPDGDLRGTYTEVRGLGEDVVVVVDGAHAELFAQIRRALTRPSRSMAEPSGSIAMILQGDEPIQSWSVSATGAVEEMGAANVVGRIEGRRTDEFVLFSAHYDHIGIRPAVDGDSIANGANDNGSGTTAVITLAKYFAAMGTPERTLLFVAFTGEESGGYGSRYFSEQLDPDQIVAMFNIEMIGKPAVSGPNTAWITGYERSDFGTVLGEAVEGTGYTFYADPYPDQNLFYRSDNATLARLGVPAHTISTTPIDVDPDYHRVTDHVSTLDLDHMTNTIEAIALGAETIISGERTPARVDPATVN